MSENVESGANTTEAGTAAPAEATLLASTAAAATPPAGQQDAKQEPPKVEPTEAEKAEAAKAEAAKAAEVKGAPAEYAEFSMPEGVQMDAELGTDLKTAAKDMNLTQDQAQKLADLGAKQAQKFQQAQSEAMQKARETWETESKADKEFGGEKFGENLAVAKKAMDAYASPELKTLLNQTGLGNHPEFIRLMVKAGQAISEDRIVPGRSAGTSAQAKPAAERLYGKTTT